MAPASILRCFAALFVTQAPSAWALAVQKSVTTSNKTSSVKAKLLVEMPEAVATSEFLIAPMTAGSRLYKRVAGSAPIHFLLHRAASVGTAQDETSGTPGQLIGSVLIWGILTGIIAYFYHKNRELPELDSTMDNDKEREELKNWKVTPFSCMTEPKIFAFSLFCPSIRWAHTLSVLDILGFWPGFAIFYGLALLNAFTAGLLCWIALAAVCTYYRQAMRGKFNMEDGGWMMIANDCVCYAFCTCCMVAQEASQIEAAARCGHEAIVRESTEPPKSEPQEAA